MINEAKCRQWVDSYPTFRVCYYSYHINVLGMHKLYTLFISNEKKLKIDH